MRHANKDPLVPSELKKAKKIAMRLEIAILSAEKKSPSEISKHLNISRPTVYLWQRRCKEMGLQCTYQDRPRSGRRPSVSKEQEQAVITQAEQLKADPKTPYSIKTMAQSTGIQYGVTRRILLRNSLETKCKKTPEKSKFNYENNENFKSSLLSQQHDPTILSRSNRDPITQKEIGKKCGLSQGTVSRALNSDRIIKPETRLKVQQVARESSYIPNPNLSSLANRRWQQKLQFANIAILTPEGMDKQKQADLYHDFRKEAHNKGYALEVIELNEQTQFAKINHRLCQQGIQGIILKGNINQATSLKLKRALQWGRLTALSLTSSIRWLNTITEDHPYQRVEQCMQKAINKGYSRIAFLDLSRTATSSTNPNQLNHWTPSNISLYIHLQHTIHGLNRLKLPPLIFQNKNQTEQIAQLSAYLRKHTPELIFCDQDAGYSLLKEAAQGHSIPAFISLNKQDDQNNTVAGLMNQQEDIEFIMHCLDRQIRNNEWGLPLKPTKHHNTNDRWQEGHSLPPAKTPTKPQNKKSSAVKTKKARDNRSLQFDILNLQAVFNRSAQIRGQWIGNGILPLQPGIHQFHQVPFEIKPGDRLKQPNCLMMQSLAASEAKDHLPQQVTLPLKGYYAGVHILHTAGWIGFSTVFAAYKFIYADGTKSTLPLRSYGHESFSPETAGFNTLVSEQDKKIKPNIGDWNAHYPLTNKELQPGAQFLKCSTEQIDIPLNSYYLFTLHWKNPHPNKPLKALQIESDSNQKTTLALLGVTLEK